MDSTNILERLIETEKSSRELLDSAQAEIDQRMSEAKRKAEEERRLRREGAVKALEDDFSAAKKAALGEYEALVASYQASLDEKPSDNAAFSLLVKKILAAES
jgi:vacuolar-type H+-ATPase subunit H